MYKFIINSLHSFTTFLLFKKIYANTFYMVKYYLNGIDYGY